MAALFGGVLILHVASGLGALALFWAAIAATKASPLHRQLGRSYVAAMGVSLLAACALVALVLARPLAIHPGDPGLDAEALWARADALRAFALFLGEIAIITFSLLWLGFCAVRGPHAGAARGRPGDLTVRLGLATGTTAFFAAFGDGHAALVVTLASVLALAGRVDARRRLREHLIGILGSGMSAHTAFAVSVVPRLWPDLYEADPSVNAAPWIVPPLVGSLAIAVTLRHYLGARGSERTARFAPRLQRT